MKTLSGIFATCAFTVMSLFASAQDSYTLKMTIRTEGLPAEYAAFGEQEMVTYIKGDKSKSEVTSMMGNQVILYDGKKMTALNEVMGNKVGFTATKEELNAIGDKSATKPKIEYTSETKTIAGYECKKAIITQVDKDKKESKTIVWVTDKISYSHPEMNKASGKGALDLSDLKGYPLEMEMNQTTQGMEMKIIMTTTSVDTKAIDDAVFSISTEGYTMMTYKEMMEKQKAMGGK